MGNMSYCRFENTHNDLLECIEGLENKGAKRYIEETNPYERPYILALIELCRDFADQWEDEVRLANRAYNKKHGEGTVEMRIL